MTGDIYGIKTASAKEIEEAVRRVAEDLHLAKPRDLDLCIEYHRRTRASFLTGGKKPPAELKVVEAKQEFNQDEVIAALVPTAQPLKLKITRRKL